MRRIDRMNLEHQVGHPLQRRVGAERGDDVVRRADMHIERGDQLGERLPREVKSRRDEMIDNPAQADIGEAQCLVAVVGDEHGSRAEDARRASGRQRGEIGLDDRQLQIGEAGARRLLLRGCVRDSMSPSPALPARMPPPTEKVACHIRSMSCGAAG